MAVRNVGMARAGVPAIWGDVPLRNKNFTGRVDILARLREGASNGIAILPEQNPDNPLPQAVQGLGGVGKTAIAIEYAHRYQGEYDLVWWIPADQLSSVRASLAALADRLSLDQPAAGMDGAIRAVLDALRRGDPYSRWLLIFDNADEPEDIRDLLPYGPGDVLITSRNYRWQGTTNILPMNVFARKESKEFLLKRVPRGLTGQDADRLATKLGDLPLALEQAGAMLAETGMPADEYLALLDEHVTSLMAEGKSPDYPLSMTAAWKLSVSTLQRRLPEAMELLRCCAFFGPAPIPRDVFRRAGGRLTASPSAVAKVISNPILMASAIRELGRYALVTLDGTSVLVHRLVQALLRDELTEEQRVAYRTEAHRILASAVPDNPDDVAGWPSFEELLPHVNAEFTELPKSRDPEVRGLALKTMRFLHQAGDYTSALVMADRFIEQWSADSGPTHSDVVRAQRHRGNVLRVLGRYAESYKVTKEALANSRVARGETEPTTLSLRTAFAADLRAQGRFEAALELDEESRRLLESVYEPGDSRILRLVSSLALDYGLNSNYKTAGELYDEAFQGMRPSSSDATAYDVLGAWLGIAWTLRLLGKYDEAFDVSLDARDYAQSAKGLGPESLATLRSINEHTIVCRRLPDKREEALELARTAHEVATRIFGTNHPDTLAIAVSLSNLLRTIGDAHHPEALALAEKTVASYPGVYGDSHPYNFGCRSNLALLHRVTGSPEKARAIDELALAGLTRVLGPDHHFTLTVAMNLASDFAVLGLPEEARRLGEATLPRLAALLGPDHAHTLGCAANLALDRIATGDDDAGRALQNETLESYQATYGVDFPDYTVVAESVTDRSRRLDLDFDPPPI